MNKKIFLVASLSLMLTACGGDDDNEVVASGSEIPESATPESTTPESTTPESTPEVSTMEYKCPATVVTDDVYSDYFIANNTADRDWGIDQSIPFQYLVESIDVAQIAREFNEARALDPTIHEKLQMPEQVIWNNMSSSEKTLYLVNSERCARGIMPFQGIVPNMVDSADAYASVLAATRILTHGEPAAEKILERMEAAAVNVSAGGNADFVFQNESLAMHQANTDGDGFLSLYEPEVKAVYTWLYDDIEDQGTGYGHRTHLLRNQYVDNSGDANVEGLFGLANQVITFEFESGGDVFKATEAWTVLHSFDPNGSFSMASITAAPSLMGPSSQTDCQRDSTFTAAEDADGNNTSTCVAN